MTNPIDPHDMTTAELQAEIGRLQGELTRRVCGDPVKGVGLTIPPVAGRSIEPFVVRHYTGDELPCIKGNGFDGLQVGESREVAEALVSWLNEVIRDAERYRAVRELDWFEDDLAVVRHPKQAVKLGHDCPSRERLDEFVDEIVARRADS